MDRTSNDLSIAHLKLMTLKNELKASKSKNKFKRNEDNSFFEIESSAQKRSFNGDREK